MPRKVKDGKRPLRRSSANVAGRARRSRRVKGALACLLVGVLLATPIPFVNTAIGYVPFIAYLFALLLSWVYLRLLKGSLSFSQAGVGEGCLRGDQLPFEFTLDNASVLPAIALGVSFSISDLFGGERACAKRVVSLLPRSSKTFDFGVRFDHIGTYGVGIREIEVSDPFGIFRHVVRFDELKQVSVQPRVCDVSGLEVSTEASKESNRAITTVLDDGMDYCGVREYRWGDPIKAIHWKLSARTPSGTYFTRLYETSRNPGLAVVIDCDAPEGFTAEQLMDAYDGLVEAALSIEAWASGHSFETEVLFADKTGRRRRFTGPLSGSFGDILERLPHIAAGDGTVALDIVRSESNSIYAQDNLVLCSCRIGDELVGELIRVRAGRHNPILIAVEPHGLEDEERKRRGACLTRLAGAGIAYAAIQGASELGGSGR